MRLALLVLVGLGGCTGHYTVPIDPPDAEPAATDAANACTGALYDPCTTDEQCMSGICRSYTGTGFSACTEACSMPSTPTCPPDSTGIAAGCNKMGQCRPTQPNDCTR